MSPAARLELVPTADAEALLSLAQKAGGQGLYIESIEWAQAALKACPDKDVALRAQILKLLATHQWRLGQAEATMRAGTQALLLLEKLDAPADQSSILCAMCMACNQIGLHNQALNFAFRALRAAQQVGDRLLECWALNRVGVTYDDQADHATAQRYLNQATEIARELGGREEMFGALNNLARSELFTVARELSLGTSLSSNGQLALGRAGQLCEETYQLAQRWSNPHMEAMALLNLAEVKTLSGQLDEALQSLQQACEVARQHGYQYIEETSLYEQARLLQKSGQFELAIASLAPQLERLQHSELGSLVFDCETALYECHKAVGHAAQALQHLENLRALERTRLERRADEQARVLMAQMEVDQARQDAERSRLDAELQRLRAQRLEEEQRSLLLHAASLGRAAREDPLTGLGNRRLLDESLPGLLEHSRSERTPLALVMLDVDHFKRVNDEHGHAVGDQVLSRLARLLLAGTRTSDLVARIGGEEFIAVLVGTPIDLAADICERLRYLVEQHGWDELSPGLKVTISLGLVEVNDPVETARLMALADKALYCAKREGRNRVVRSV